SETWGMKIEHDTTSTFPGRMKRVVPGFDPEIPCQKEFWPSIEDSNLATKSYHQAGESDG
ncbi:hypothetical protein, partial [Halococcus morrhuae]|uniref:hypothetical protein n=1 Tax=Halococcus morrhuae TaxID=2250 RepID=UPI0019554797